MLYKKLFSLDLAFNLPIYILRVKSTHDHQVHVKLKKNFLVFRKASFTQALMPI